MGPPVGFVRCGAGRYARHHGMTALSTARSFASLVRLSHTIFGLPFALAATALAHRHATASDADGGLSWLKLGLIVLAFTGARAAAMGFNRIVDRHIDGRNPRTASREIPAGVISVKTAWAFTLGSAAVFLGAAALLGTLPAILALPCLLVVFGYSFFKRFSWSAHLFLGLALALAPGGAWLAVTDSFSGWPTPLLLMAAVGTWVAGFDILYSLQDASFDREQGLHSIPARFGIVGSLWLSGLLHVLTVGALVGLHLYAGLGAAHLAGVGLIAAILVYEHAIVRPEDLSRINKAFFDLNGYISLAYLACTLLDLWLA